MRCPKGFVQKPPKSGNCVKSVKKSALTKKNTKRCANGTRKNKKTGKCEKIQKIDSKKEEVSTQHKTTNNKKKMSQAKFYDIAEQVTPDYFKDEFVPGDGDEFNGRIKKYLNKNKNIKYGDIIFVGSTTETRQETGFKIVLDDGNTLSGVYGPDLPVDDERVYKQLIERGIRYDDIINTFNPDKPLNITNFVLANWYGGETFDKEEFYVYRDEFLYLKGSYKENGLLSN